MIQRYYDNLGIFLTPGKVLAVFGPRQVGKTTLVQKFLAQTNLKFRSETGDNTRLQALFEELDFKKVQSLVEGFQLLVIDEAQKVPNIGEGLKILVDSVPDIQIVVTGSASFELAGQIGEPLTGRKRTLLLYPVGFIELAQQYNTYDLRQRLPEVLVYGGYPAVITATGLAKKRAILEELLNSFLLKDILSLERVKSPKLLLDLLRLLAYQVGSEVSIHELGKQLGVDSKTVARYLGLFEQSFILYNVRGYTTNLRKSITKKSKYYFYDTGIRNAIISNFNSLETRDDVGRLWENFVFIERLKKRSYQELFANTFFWRTYSGEEVDIIEERDGRLYGYECKWSTRAVKPPSQWTALPRTSFEVVHKENFLDFVT
jgi:uncharacterized protein